jgi:hypothetical protein
VTEKPSSPEDRRPDPADFDVDTRVARPARLYNYLAGGAGNFAIDREAAERVAAAAPGGLDTIRAAVQSIGDFTQRAVQHLVDEAGVRQFLYIGTPVPAGREVHEVAQDVAPEARVVYVGNDPVVLAHAHELTRSTPEGATAYVHGTLHAPEEIWKQATETLDPAQPVAILLPVTLCLVPDDADPHGIIDRLLDPAASGSYLVIAHTSGDITGPGGGAGEGEGGDRGGDRGGEGGGRSTTPSEAVQQSLPEQYVFRSPREIARFFAGLELVEPGLVPINDWRPVPGAPPPGIVLPMHAGLARKP